MAGKSAKPRVSGGAADDESDCCGCFKRKKKEKSLKSLGNKSARSTVESTPKAPNPPMPSLEAASGMLPVRSKRERDIVTKALEEEMERRRRWRRLLRAKGLKAAAGPTKGDIKFPIPIEEIVATEVATTEPVGTSESSTSAEMSSRSRSGDGKVSDLESQRREWVNKMQLSAPPPQPGKPGWESQPESMTIDSEAAQEIASHTLVNMLRKILVQASENEELQKEKEKDRSKPPEKMTPEELVQFRQRDPKAWDEFVSANSLVSFGLAKPTPDDLARAKKRLGTKKRKEEKESENSGGSLRSKSDQSGGSGSWRSRARVRFDPRVDTFAAPIGDDFDPNEKVKHHVTNLKK